MSSRAHYRLRPMISGRLVQGYTFRRRNIAYLRLWLGRLVFWGGAVGVGLLAVGFANLSEHALHRFMNTYHAYFWMPFIVTPLGGALCVYLTRRFFPGAEGSGIPQAIAELSRPKQGLWKPLVSIRIIFGKILIGTLAVGCGFSLGREGPTVQVGASLMDAIHRFLPRTLFIQRSHLLIAGGAAGIAAAFNTPLAGIMFAIEEMSRGVETRMSGLVITAIILAGVVAQALLGGGNYFGHIFIGGGQSDTIKAVAVSSLVCGLAGGVFSRILVGSATSWTGVIADYRRDHPIRFAAISGLIVAVLGVLTGGILFGSGYEPTRALLEGHADLPWYFGPLKFVSTLIAYLSGLPGGIFAPSLAIGAGIGHDLAPLVGQVATPGMLLVLCMAGFLAAATQAPLTSFIIVMEMADGYSIVIGLMATALLSSGLSRLISPPLYHTIANLMHARQRAAANAAALATAPTEPPSAEATPPHSPSPTEESLNEAASVEKTPTKAASTEVTSTEIASTEDATTEIKRL